MQNTSLVPQGLSSWRQVSIGDAILHPTTAYPHRDTALVLPIIPFSSRAQDIISSHLELCSVSYTVTALSLGGLQGGVAVC